MSIRMRAVRIHQVPESMTPSESRTFLKSLQECAESERPRFVLDCSRLSTLDGSTISLLLCCLEEVMKCNGDVRLAALTPEAESMLRQAGVHRLFEMYATPESAVHSFHLRPTSLAPLSYEEDTFDSQSERAA